MFEAKIPSLEENKKNSETTVAKLVNDMQASKQITSLSMEEKVYGAFLAPYKVKNQNFKSFGKKKFSPCPHCKNISFVRTCHELNIELVINLDI